MKMKFKKKKQKDLRR